MTTVPLTLQEKPLADVTLSDFVAFWTALLTRGTLHLTNSEIQALLWLHYERMAVAARQRGDVVPEPPTAALAPE